MNKKPTNKPVPKKALENFINTIFTPNINSDINASDMNRERSSTTLQKKHRRFGKVSFGGRTEQASPRDEGDVDPLNKPQGVFISKTKRLNFADEQALGPGYYNPHEFTGIGPPKESAFKKKTDFGNQEGRKFSLHRNLQSPFKDSTYLENPDSWRYQHPEKESAFNLKKVSQTLEKTSIPLSLAAVTKSAHKKNSAEMPGPGHYDTNFKDELKVLDQKLSVRYQLGPFGSTSPRFKEKPAQSEPTND
jgi:hypothetical protein